MFLLRLNNRMENMANTYSQMYAHIIFSTKNREPILKNNFRHEVFKYMAGITNNRGLKSFAINGTSDHVHLFVGFSPSIKLSEFVRDLKHFSSVFIKERRFLKCQFNWQNGFGSFTYSHSQIDTVIKYIMNQEKHHKTKSFSEEYIDLLNKFNVKYDRKYLLG